MEVLVYRLPDMLDPPLPSAFLVHHWALFLGSVTSSVYHQEGYYNQDNESNPEDRLQVRRTHIITRLRFLGIRSRL